MTEIMMIEISKMRALIDKIDEADNEYYLNNNEIISNREYDDLKDQLQKLEETTGVVLSNSPLHKVSGEVASYLEKVKHPKKMLSLDKTKSEEDLKNWLGKNTGLLSYKLDGITVVLSYKNGILAQATTRGNGIFGEDITINAKMFKNIPIKINYDGDLVVRGEAIISYNSFDKINSSLSNEEKYKNPRNLCSGVIRQLNSGDSRLKEVQFILFDVVSNYKDIKSKEELFNEMKYTLGFDVVSFYDVNSENISDHIKNMTEYVKNGYDIPCDGLVLTFDNIDYCNSLGETTHHPRSSIAFKWFDELYSTNLIDVEWNTSRTGLITPVAIFEPIDIDGSTVERASIHNLSIFKKLQFGVGDEIQVYKANMIIPQIEENLTCSNTFEYPKVCPSCGKSTIVETSETGIEILTCHNKDCPAQIIFKLKHFCSRDAMNIKGLSDKKIEIFVERGWLNNLYDLYELKNYKEEMINIPRFGEKSVNNILNAIEESRNIDLQNFLYSLGISAMGRTNSRILCEKFNNDLSKIRNTSIDELLSIDGFGPETANEIVSFFSNKENSNIIDNLLKYITFNKIEEKQKEEKTIEGNFIHGKVFVITGKMINFSNRREIENLIKSKGGIIKTAVSKTVDYLINNNINSIHSKNRTAKELNIPIISEEDFINMLK